MTKIKGGTFVVSEKRNENFQTIISPDFPAEAMVLITLDRGSSKGIEIVDYSSQSGRGKHIGSALPGGSTLVSRKKNKPIVIKNSGGKDATGTFTVFLNGDGALLLEGKSNPYELVSSDGARPTMWRFGNFTNDDELSIEATSGTKKLNTELKIGETKILMRKDDISVKWKRTDIEGHLSYEIIG